MPQSWFDAHLDLAYLAVRGRKMLDELDPSQGPDAPASVTIPELKAAGVRMCLGTIFTEKDGDGPEAYPADDIERAHTVGRAQLEAYQTWRDEGVISLDRFADLRRQTTTGLGEIRGGMGVAEVVPLGTRAILARLPRTPSLSIGILMENADPIRSPSELGWWKERGVVAIGLSWAKSSRYAGGNMDQHGLTPLGRELVSEMDRLKVLHDVSHLSRKSFDDLCSLSGRTIVASHSNVSAIVDPSGLNQRHLLDAQIREIIARKGVIGLNLFTRFIRPNLVGDDRPSLDETIAHIEHICALAGSTAHVGLGSDMDGGFSAKRLPAGIDRARDIHRLLEALSAKGWTDDQLLEFSIGNWLRIFS